MQHDFVANGDPLTNDERKSRIGVQYRGILDIALVANGDLIVVTAHHGL